jgi:hypothetical protein
MNFKEYQFLRAELGELERMLADLPASHVIERMSLEARKQDVEEELASQPAPTRQPVRAHLTFRGRPVVGSHGVFAEFGAAAVAAFSEAVAAVGASQSKPLGSRGVLPARDDHRLLITGTAQGSFGFQLEEAAVEDLALFPKESPLEDAIAQTKAILQASLGTNDELSEALSETDPRALDAIRKFLEVMAKNDAMCALAFKDAVFRFADLGQVRQSLTRLEQGNIHEKEEQLAGAFVGVLPHRRNFEFRLADTSEVISGKVGTAIADAAAINQMLGRPVTIKVRSRRVGDGRPRYVLLGFSEGSPSAPSSAG